MADGIDELLLWGDDFEVILDILEGDEAVEQQFVTTANNVSSNFANFNYYSNFFLPTQNGQNVRLLHLRYDKLLESLGLRSFRYKVVSLQFVSLQVEVDSLHM